MRVQLNIESSPSFLVRRLLLSAAVDEFATRTLAIKFLTALIYDC